MRLAYISPSWISRVNLLNLIYLINPWGQDMVFYNIFLNNDLPFNRSHSIIKQTYICSCQPWEYANGISHSSARWLRLSLNLHLVGVSYGCILMMHVNECTLLHNFMQGLYLIRMLDRWPKAQHKWPNLEMVKDIRIYASFPLVAKKH